MKKYNDLFPTCPECLNESLKMGNSGKGNVMFCENCKTIFRVDIMIKEE